MEKLQLEAALYRQRHDKRVALTAQTAAFYLMTGIDLSIACSSSMIERARTCCKLERLIERERLKGVQGHWSYDLARHAALKQALDRIQSLNE